VTSTVEAWCQRGPCGHHKCVALNVSRPFVCPSSLTNILPMFLNGGRTPTTVTFSVTVPVQHQQHVFSVFRIPMNRFAYMWIPDPRLKVTESSLLLSEERIWQPSSNVQSRSSHWRGWRRFRSLSDAICTMTRLFWWSGRFRRYSTSPRSLSARALLACFL